MFLLGVLFLCRVVMISRFLGSMFGMFNRMCFVSMRLMCVTISLLVFTFFVELSRFLVMFGGTTMMVCGPIMMLSCWVFICHTQDPPIIDRTIGNTALAVPSQQLHTNLSSINCHVPQHVRGVDCWRQLATGISTIANWLVSRNEDR